MDNNLFTIGEAAKVLGVSIDTLRRWDERGQLKSIRSKGGHRYYFREQIENYSKDIFRLAEDWTLGGVKISSAYYCPDSAVFQARLVKMSNELSIISDNRIKEIFSLIVAVAGEIGNNSFDHNLGNWPDEPGVFFGFDISKRCIILADRGQGILKTLRRIRPGLSDDSEALTVAFTEIISGRAPEERGNGLKFVKEVIAKNGMKLFFRTGDAELEIINSDPVSVRKSSNPARGCLASIIF